MTPRALICDISRYQGKVDFRKMRAAGAAGVICRATVGDYYQEPQLERNYQESRAAGLLFGAYLVIAPADSDGRRIDAAAHLEKYGRALEGVRGGSGDPPLTHTVDAELDRGCDAAWITAVIQGVVRGLASPSGRVRIYTRQSWWDRFVLPWSGWAEYGLHAARYVSGSAAPHPERADDSPGRRMLAGPWSDGRFKFRDWQSWQLWQFSADGNRQGLRYGAESADIDLNWWNGTEVELRAWAAQAVQTAPTNPQSPPAGAVELERRVRAIEDYLRATTTFRL